MRELTVDEHDVVSGGEYNLIGMGWSTVWSSGSGGFGGNLNYVPQPGDDPLIDVAGQRMQPYEIALYDFWRDLQNFDRQDAVSLSQDFEDWAAFAGAAAGVLALTGNEPAAIAAGATGAALYTIHLGINAYYNIP